LSHTVCATKGGLGQENENMTFGIVSEAD
jgi:hypothetical protein